MFRLAFARVRNRQDAEDIVQEAYLKAYRSYESFNHRTTVKSWLTQILLNTIRDHFRKTSRTIQTVELIDSLEDSAIQSSIPGPEDQLSNAEFDPALKKALESMPDQFVTPLLLREIHDASYDEIAQLLDIPQGTVMSRLFRARSLLRKHLLADSQPVDSNGTSHNKSAHKAPRGFSDELQ
jgi:RNA polymerase sigma-70 factor (ECF subfamily)